MPPKVKITKEDIVNAAVALVRQRGPQALNARELASRLCCSTQPIFSNFASMEQLRLSVVEKAEAVYFAYTRRETDSGQYPVYKASGMAYIRFAKEETELFKLLYMCDRESGSIPENKEFNRQVDAMVQEATGLDSSRSQLFHLEMWAAVHGVATMFATNYLDLPWELVSQMLTDIYRGLRKQYEME